MTAGREDSDEIIVRVPDELPVLTREVSRILLAVLLELTEGEAPREPREGVSDDC
jgi:hypothetical protein